MGLVLAASPAQTPPPGSLSSSSHGGVLVSQVLSKSPSDRCFPRDRVPQGVSPLERRQGWGWDRPA